MNRRSFSYALCGAWLAFAACRPDRGALANNGDIVETDAGSTSTGVSNGGAGPSTIATAGAGGNDSSGAAGGATTIPDAGSGSAGATAIRDAGGAATGGASGAVVATPDAAPITMGQDAAPTITPPKLDAAPPPPPPPPPADPAAYNFEVDAQGWIDLQSAGTGTRRATDRHFAGVASLAVDLDTRADAPGKADTYTRYIGLPATLLPALHNGQVITFHVWLPTDNQVLGVQPFVVTKGTSTTPGDWMGVWNYIDDLAKGQWNTLPVTVPAVYDVNDMQWMGVQFITKTGWQGTVFIDSVGL